MARDTQASALYLRAPVRGSSHAVGDPLPFAWSQRGRIQRSGSAPLAELGPLLAGSERVVLLLAASDVTLLNLPVPPLPASRLQAALPALVEEHIIGDPVGCAIAAGPEVDGRRMIAVADHDWLQSWVGTLRQHGARRIMAQPMQLCLPLLAGRMSAALLENPGAPQLALRLSADEGIGLPVAVDDPAQLADVVAELLATFARGEAVELSVPAVYASALSAWSQAHPESGIDFVDEDWAAWIDGASRLEIDLVRGLAASGERGIEWRRWRVPLVLAAACLLFNVIALNWDWWRLRSEGLRLQDGMTALYRRTFPNDQQVVDPLAQMRQKVMRARQSGGEFAPDDFLALSAVLGDAWGGKVNDPRAIAGLDYRDATLNVRLKQGTQVTLDSVRPELAARRVEAVPSPADPSVWQIRSLP